MSNNATKNSALCKPTKLHYLLLCMLFLFNYLPINLLHFFPQMHFLLPCLCKSHFRFYLFFSFFLYYILPSIFILFFLFLPHYFPFIEFFLILSAHFFSMTVLNLHFFLHFSFPNLPLFTLIFTISSCLSTHTHKDRNGLAVRFYGTDQHLWYMHYGSLLEWLL